MIKFGTDTNLVLSQKIEQKESFGYIATSLIFNNIEALKYRDANCRFFELYENDRLVDKASFTSAKSIQNSNNPAFELTYYLDKTKISEKIKLKIVDENLATTDCSDSRSPAINGAGKTSDEESSSDLKKQRISNATAEATAPKEAVNPNVIPINAAANHIIGYVFFSEPHGTRIVNRYSIKNKPSSRFPAPGDILVNDISVNGNPPSTKWLRAYPQYYDPAMDINFDPVKDPQSKVMEIKENTELRVGGDVIISENGRYAWAPINQIFGDVASVRASVRSPADLLKKGNILGYAYFGYEVGGEFTSKKFKVMKDQNCLEPMKDEPEFPGPKSCLQALSNVNLRELPKQWNPDAGSYTNPKIIRVIEVGKTLITGGDVIISAGGQSIWVPVKELR